MSKDTEKTNDAMARLGAKLDAIKAAQDAIVRAMRVAEEGPPSQVVQDAADVLLLWLSAQAIGSAMDVVRVKRPRKEK